jgi:hypothetical protein
MDCKIHSISEEDSHSLSRPKRRAKSIIWFLKVLRESWRKFNHTSCSRMKTFSSKKSKWETPGRGFYHTTIRCMRKRPLISAIGQILLLKRRVVLIMSISILKLPDKKEDHPMIVWQQTWINLDCKSHWSAVPLTKTRKCMPNKKARNLRMVWILTIVISEALKHLASIVLTHIS